MKSVVLITGISGSGKSVALRQLEDLGYNCVDNLPLPLLYDFALQAHDRQTDKVAIAIDARTPGDIEQLPADLKHLQEKGFSFLILFLEADDQTLRQRYSESRRRHPLTESLTLKKNNTPSLEECIVHERNLMSALRPLGHVLDTSHATPIQLRRWITDIVGAQKGDLLLTFESFAFKRGVPSGADLVFDVRCLPNPHYVQELKPLTGRDEPVAQWLAGIDDVHELLEDISDFIQKWLPAYTLDTRSYLTIAIGCTGGQHRSVYIVEQLAKRFSDHKPLRVRHRALTAAS